MMFAVKERPESFGIGSETIALPPSAAGTNIITTTTTNNIQVETSESPTHQNFITRNPDPRDNDIAMNNNAENRPTIRPETWKETAWDWYRRSRQQQSRRPSSAQLRRRAAQQSMPRDPPTNPFEAAWDFFQTAVPSTVNVATTVGGTGIAVVDAALAMPARRRRQPRITQPLTQPQPSSSMLPLPFSLPVLEISGDRQTGKTWTLICLAARYVVATLPSQFSNPATTPPEVMTTAATTTFANIQHNRCLPQVILLDSSLDITTSKLAFSVVSTLLRTTNNINSNTDPKELERDIECCLQRIHICHADFLSGWVPVVESMRCHLIQQQGALTKAPAHSDAISTDTNPRSIMNRVPPPTLLLWDGFLSEPSDAPTRAELTRQLVRLIQDVKTVAPVIGTASSSLSRSSLMGNSSDWGQLITHRIQLLRNPDVQNTDNGHGFVGQVTTSSTAASNTASCWSAETTHVPYSISTAGVLS